MRSIGINSAVNYCCVIASAGSRELSRVHRQTARVHGQVVRARRDRTHPTEHSVTGTCCSHERARSVRAFSFVACSMTVQLLLNDHRVTRYVLILSGIYQVALTHKKLGITKDILATKVIPHLFPLVIDSNLNLAQVDFIFVFLASHFFL